MDWGDGLHGSWSRRLSKSQIKKMQKEMKEATENRENKIKQKENNKKILEELEAEKLLLEFDKNQNIAWLNSSNNS